MDVLALVAQLTLDKSGYEQGLSEAESQASSTGGKLGKVLGSVGKVAGTVAKVTAAGITAGAAAVGFLTKQSVEAYGSYEQLSGGVKKLFGDAADDVMTFANQAYKTAGMSANQYMDQATGFAASLINSLGGDTKEAAHLADVAMQSMSDNVNTFGSDMQSVQYAFQGFAKQNYTMLDNLKLGYGGTQAEMQRLIADAAKATDAQEKLGLSVDGTSMSFDNIVKAIQVVQYEQGIAGTTAAEAAKTIEGAFNMTKAAWSNLVAGFANPDADLGQLMDNLIVALVGDKQGTGLLNNLMPAIQRALEGIGTLVSKAAPVISKYLPALANSLLPSVLSAATSLVVSIAKALPGIAKVIVAQIPMIAKMLLDAFSDMGGEFASMGGDLMNFIMGGINNKAPELGSALTSLGETFSIIVDRMKQFWDEHGSEILTKAGEIFNGIKDFVITALTFVTEFINGFIQTALALWDEFGSGIMGYLTAVKDFWIAVFQVMAENVTTFIENLKAFWAEWGDEILSVAQTVWNAVSTIISTVLQVITGIVQAFTALVQGDWSGFLTAIQTVTSTIFSAISAFIGSVLQVIRTIISTVWNAIKAVITTVLNAIKAVVTTVWNAIKTAISTALNAVKSVITTVWNAIKAFIQTTLSNIQSIVTTVWDAIKTAVSTVLNAIKSVVSTVWDAIKTTISNAINAVKTTIENGFNAAKDKVSTIVTGIKDKISTVFTAAKDKVTSVVDGIKDKISDGFSAAKEKVTSIFDSIKEKIKGAMDAAKEAVSNAIEKIKSKMHFHWSLPKLKLPHISINGKFSLNPPSVPHFSISWHRKAMENPWLFTAPTVAMGFGEAGDEMVYGRDNLMRDIREATGSNNDEMVSLLRDILDRLNELDPVITLDGRRVTANVDRRLGSTVQLKQRGVI